MKQIKNWRNGTVADIEADGLLDDVSKIHVISYEMANGRRGSIRGDDIDRIKSFFKYHIDKEIPVVGHNFITYDVPALEKVLGLDLSELMVVDTLFLSWHINHKRNTHGLADYGEDYGVPKPEVEDWENQPYEVYQHRCEEDVKINSLLWKDLLVKIESLFTKCNSVISGGGVGGRRNKGEVLYIDRFVGESVDDYITRWMEHLMFKADCIRLAEDTMFEVDVSLLKESIYKMEGLEESIKKELESSMPKVPKYIKANKPSKMYKKDGSLSTFGERWLERSRAMNKQERDEYGNLISMATDNPDELRVISGYSEPNGGSSEQIKALLFSHGWRPQSFNYVMDEALFQEWINSKPQEGSGRGAWNAWRNARPKAREIPQITVQGDDGRELCESVLDLAEEVPAIKKYAEFNVVRHRLATLRGFERNLVKGKYLKAGAAGLTNTKRIKHVGLVNLVGVDKPYGDVIRGVLVAGGGHKLVGADLSSLEDRVKHHFMLSYDPEYVATMQRDDYDPHLDMAVTAGLLTEEDAQAYKDGDRDTRLRTARAAGKSGNYCLVYGGGAATTARTAGVTQEEGQRLFDAYWKLNWSVKAISEDQQVVIDDEEQMWLVNPINGFPYSLRKENDIFSTLCQGTGAYLFDQWLREMIRGSIDRGWGKPPLAGQWHDEFVLRVKDSDAAIHAVKKLIHESIEKVNETFMLRREMGCEVQVGDRYSEIH